MHKNELAIKTCEYVYGNVISPGINDLKYFLKCNLLWKDYPIKINPDSIWYNVMQYWCKTSFESASVLIEKGKTRILAKLV